MVGYPLYFAYDVWVNGMQNHCTGRNKGVFCDWGPSLGAQLFDAEHAHRGLSVLLIAVAIVMSVFLLWVSSVTKNAQNSS